ncbi:hydroxyacid dehydrogenase [Paenibacillus sp. GYB003]|uniref:hydroxyacid dehydrogenase n=1 Tax=Paenibacillus sp. GYB003 TaxID=2994392 RepID=UPI002F96249E
MVKVGVLIPANASGELFSPESRARLESFASVVWNDTDKQLDEEKACELLHDCDVAVGSWRTAIPTRRILDRCGNLKLWEHAAGSVKHFFTHDLRGRSLLVASCAPAIAKTVAEMVLGELIIGLRRIVPNALQNRTEQGKKPANKLYLAKATVGIIGASSVGRQVVELLRPFQTRVLLYDPYLTADGAAKLGVTNVDSLTELCAACDAITLHTPKTSETYHLLKEEQFRAMKDDAVFINTSRGDCIDEQALIRELQRGRLFAFLDVSDPEPALPDNPIRTLPNVIYTSHLAGGASTHIGDQAVDDIAAFASGGRPLMVVDRSMLATMA